MSVPSESNLQSNPHIPGTSPTASPRPAMSCARQVRKLHLPQALQLAVCVRPAKRTLAAARAPACLQQSLQRKTGAARRLRMACAWAEAAMPQPRLFHGPLFGTCLEDVLRPGRRQHNLDQGQEPPAAEAAGPAHRQSPALPRPPREVTPASKRPERPGPRSLILPAQAGLELLVRRAGGHRVLSQFTGAPRRNGRLLAVAARRTTPGLHLPVTPGLPPEWLARLENRLAWRLQQARSRLNGVEPGISAYAGELTRAMSGWVAHALALDPAGVTAPLASLQRLAGAPQRPAQEPSSRQRTAAPLEAVATPELLSSPLERAATGITAWEAPFSRTSRGEAASPLVEPPTGAQQGFYPQIGSLPLPAAGQPNYRPLVAPPLAAQILPTLLPPHTGFDAPTPYASAAARLLAQQDEERLLEEDLDVLAAKIKRILSDEAYRHGIQV